MPNKFKYKEHNGLFLPRKIEWIQSYYHDHRGNEVRLFVNNKATFLHYFFNYVNGIYTIEDLNTEEIQILDKNLARYITFEKWSKNRTKRDMIEAKSKELNIC
jgi:hypothetical protein